jgi:hypothetical protein
MNSPPILEEIHVINIYDDSSFIKALVRAFGKAK